MSAPTPDPVRPDAPVRSGGPFWDAHASWWKQTFTGGADVEYDQEILPLVAEQLTGCTRVLEVGCGEGQVLRHLARTLPGTASVGLDPSWVQLGYAQAAGGPIVYLQGAGEELPFVAASFDGVCCNLAIEHADDPDAVLAEVARVLAPGGRFLLLVNHPLFQGAGSGLVDDQILGERYWRVGPYLDEVVTVEEVDQNVRVPFAHRPISRYLNPLAAAGVYCTEMFEPRPIPEFLATSVDPALEAAIPRLLAMRFERLGR